MPRFRALILSLVLLLFPACGGSTSAPDVSPDASTTPETTQADIAEDAAADGDSTSTADAVQTDLPTTPDATGEPTPGADETVVAFDDEHIYFGAENHRSADIQVDFPAEEFTYESITLEFELGCPNGKCDWWDRYGWLAIVENAGTEEEVVVEFWRYITPYRVGANWTYDVSDLRPLLTGNRTVRVFIDTWVGPGHQNGDGWLVDARFVFKGGVPTKLPVALVAIWPSQRVVYGDPNFSTNPALTTTYTFPAKTHYVEMRMLITGHGQGNAENCAEFCPKTHAVGFGGEWRYQTIWRDDCATTAVPDQFGTYTYPRAGWCPGAFVYPWVEDFTGFASPGQTMDLNYAAEEYLNTCRPDSENCTGCVFGTPCAYDGGNHTEPNYVVSGLLVIYAK